MLEAVDSEQFQQHLWNMFSHAFGGAMSLPQLDRVRWNMFPEVRVQTLKEVCLTTRMQTPNCPASCASWIFNKNNWPVHWATAIGLSMVLPVQAKP